MLRKPAVAGRFYAGSERELRAQIKACLGSHSNNHHQKDKAIKPIAAISPHAGYQFSGPCQAQIYKQIPKDIQTVIIIGLSHQGYSTCISLQDWQTPMGILKADNKLLQLLGLPIDEQAHQYEHSIEVQLPFLQYLREDVKIAPIIASADMNYKEIAEKIYQAIKKASKKIFIIASSDFTHYGPDYQYVPFTEDKKKKIYEFDQGAIDHIINLNAQEFLAYVQQTEATICGRYPIAVLIELVKKLGAKRAHLLSYYTSADVLGDYTNAVGYAAIAVEE